MRDVTKPQEDSEVAHIVKAKLTVNDVEINNVPCHIYLPERIQGKPKIIIKSTEGDLPRIMASHMGALKASVYGINRNIEISIDAPEIYFTSGSTKHWGEDITDTTITGEPQDLHIVRYLGDRDNSEKTQVVFFVSQNKYLSPFTMQTASYTGEIKIERVRKSEFILKDGVVLFFDKHFRSKYAKNGDFIQWSFLVACVEMDVPANDADAIKLKMLPVIDDFLLVASFAARRRTACLGWTANDACTHATFYRGNYVFPESDSEQDLNDGVIDISEFKNFMEASYPVFLDYENKLALRSALYSVVPSTKDILELSFLHMFTGLETLILDFRRREGFEYVLSDNDWNAFREQLSNFIKGSTEPRLSSQQRASIYNKLGELNRVSLREAFDKFCNANSINLAELWPVFGRKECIGLADIRNKLIHGDPFPSDLIDALSLAKQHMAYILERVLTRVLQWDIADTKVSHNYLKANFLAINDMSDAQERLGRYIQQGS